MFDGYLMQYGAWGIGDPSELPFWDLRNILNIAALYILLLNGLNHSYSESFIYKQLAQGWKNGSAVAECYNLDQESTICIQLVNKFFEHISAFWSLQKEHLFEKTIILNEPE